MAKWMQGCLVALSVLGVAGLSGWLLNRSPTPGLDRPAAMTLYSLDGRDSELAQPLPGGESFHGYPVLGKVEITDPVARQEIAASLRAGLNEPGVNRAACFCPRHGVRTVSRGQAIDSVICFECYQAAVHEGDTCWFRTMSRTPQMVLNQHLTAAGVVLAPEMIEDDQ